MYNRETLLHCFINFIIRFVFSGLDLSEIKQKWSTNNKQSLAQLWLGMLRFYAVEFNYTEFMVCIDSSSLKPRKTRKLFIVGEGKTLTSTILVFTRWFILWQNPHWGTK
jgi:DNA polymerase sigma